MGLRHRCQRAQLFSATQLTVQNNPRSQAAFLELDPLPALVQLPTTSDRGAEVRSKALFCISGLLKHFPDAITRFSALHGFRTLAHSLQGALAPL